MTNREVSNERKMFEQHQYSLNFMLNDDELQDDEEIRDIFLKEMTKKKD